MHELAVIENIMKISIEVAEENKLSEIDKVNLCVGKLHHLNEMIMQNAFSAVKSGTLLSNAKLLIDWEPVKLRCSDCESEYEPENNFFSCPVCSSALTEVVRGRELYVKSIEGQ